jgi:hypothetical protein
MKTPIQELIEQLEYSIGLAEGTLMKSFKTSSLTILNKRDMNRNRL